ncbi:MAG: class I poly(R)-hydroxyalkanoic acid synthase, partial [Caulobacteraceae bacterium]|nr:class I poly(R)-hydroxyalkanoic acid synthase [Caulobacteraceae bacterium]
MSATAGRRPTLSPGDLGEFSSNLARAAMIAHGAVLESGLQQAGRLHPNPDPLNLAPSLIDVFMRTAQRPESIWGAQAMLLDSALEMWRSGFQRIIGQTEKAGAADKRFADPSWDQPFFDAIRQAYLAQAKWLNSLAGSVAASDPSTRRRVAFFTKLLTDVFAPSNFLASNPDAL